jgi:hypothetical protein
MWFALLLELATRPHLKKEKGKNKNKINIKMKSKCVCMHVCVEK